MTAVPEAPEPGTDDAARLAFREIRAIMRQRGVCGLAVFQSHGRSYIVREFPDWQALRYVDDDKGTGIRVRIKRAEEPDQETYNAKAAATASVIDAMFQLLGHEAMTYARLKELIDQQWDVDWQPLSDYDPEADH